MLDRIMRVGECPALVLEDRPIELVHKRIDRRIHVVADRFHEDVLTLGVKGDLRSMFQFLDGEDHAHVDHVIEMTYNPLEL